MSCKRTPKGWRRKTLHIQPRTGRYGGFETTSNCARGYLKSAVRVADVKKVARLTNLPSAFVFGSRVDQVRLMVTPLYCKSGSTRGAPGTTVGWPAITTMSKPEAVNSSTNSVITCPVLTNSG